MFKLNQNEGYDILAVPEKHLETLVKLGLTHCQAKAYVASIQTGLASAKQISEIAMIARPDIYRVLNSLEKLGLIEKSLGKPTLIKAIPFSNGISFLIEKKQKETIQICEQSKKVLQYFTNFSNKARDKEKGPDFILIPEKEAYIRKTIEEIDLAKDNIYLITTWKRFPLTVYTFGEASKKSLNNGVKIKIILEKPPKESNLPITVEKLKNYPSFKIRYVSDLPMAVIGIFDKERIIFDTSNSAGFAEVPALWSKNSCLVKLALNHFENVWTKCSKIDE